VTATTGQRRTSHDLQAVKVAATASFQQVRESERVELVALVAVLELGQEVVIELVGSCIGIFRSHGAPPSPSLGLSMYSRRCLAWLESPRLTQYALQKNSRARRLIVDSERSLRETSSTMRSGT
jgi:hypothetical protein